MNCYTFKPLILIALLLIWAAPQGTIQAQDLLQRAKKDLGVGTSLQTQTYQGRDRLDLAMTADLQGGLMGVSPQGSARLGLNGSLDVDFACGKFDVNANLRQLFGKEAREEFMNGLLNYALSELTGSGLTLLCEASPTACQVFQHYRINANEMLKVNYDWCQSVEQGLDSGLQKSQAAAIKSCIDEKRQAGMTLDQAREACRNANKMQGLGGIQVVNLSVVGELARALNLNPEDRRRTELLLSDIKLSTRGASGEVRTEVLPEAYAKRRSEYLDAWSEALTQVNGGKKASDDTLKKLSPPGAPSVQAAEVQEIARLAPALRRLYIAQVASATALLSLTVDVHRVERLIQAAKKDPNADQGLMRQYETELVDLRRQLEQLRELAQQQNTYNRALAELSQAGQRKVHEDAASVISAIDRQNGGDKALREVTPYGKFETGRLRQGAGCTNCPTPTR